MSRVALGNFDGKCLVIFGAGYVGGAVVRQALDLGLRVVALTRNEAKAKSLEQWGANTVVADLAGVDWHERIAEADFVLNCVSSGGGGPAAYQRSYVDGMRSIARWLERRGPVDVLVYTSSTSVYPQTGGVVDELSDTTAATGSGRILLDAEKAVGATVDAGWSRRGVVLRLAGIYGPGRHHLLDQLRSGIRPLPGKGNHRLNLVHIDDIVSAIIQAFQSAGEGFEIFNVCDDRPSAKSEVVTWLAGRLGVAVPEFSGEPVPGRRPDPPDRAVSNRKLREQWGWRPRFTDFRAGYEAILGA